MKKLHLHTPGGLTDLLPGSYKCKRALERQIEAVFERYGYSFISSPSLEYLQVFESKGSIPAAEMYKLGDRNGDMLALRPDMTPAVARIAATHNLAESGQALRLCYIEKVFRDNERFQGRENEHSQAGAELMGISSPEADAELIALAVQSFLAGGLKNFRVDIGQVDFLPGVLAELEMAESKDFIKHMIRRDYVSAEKITEKFKHKIPAGKLLSELTQLTGGLDMLKRCRTMISNSQAQAALSHLEEVYGILQDQGLAEHILLDLSMTGHLGYYTGIIFKGYAKGSGTTVVDGGRYDKMNKDIPAVGFGIKIDRLLDALSAQGVGFVDENELTLLAYHKSARAVALSKADAMRKQGEHLENSLINGDLEAQKEYAKRRGIKKVLYFDEGGIEGNYHV